MRTHLIAALIAAVCLPLAACSSGSGEEPISSKPTAAKSQESKAKPPATLALGKPATTVGDGGKGELEVTPTTVVYVKEGAGQKPANDQFVVVTVKDRATSAAAAAEAPPITNGGWAWIASSGQSVDSGDGESYNVVMDAFNNAGPVQPGSFVWTARVFDLTAEQAKGGGTIVYTDGNGKAYRWKVPGTDSGPQVAEVKKQLEF